MSNIEGKTQNQYIQENPIQSTRVKRNVVIDADLSFMSNRDDNEEDCVDEEGSSYE